MSDEELKIIFGGGGGEKDLFKYEDLFKKEKNKSSKLLIRALADFLIANNNNNFMFHQLADELNLSPLDRYNLQKEMIIKDISNAKRNTENRKKLVDDITQRIKDDCAKKFK